MKKINYLAATALTAALGSNHAIGQTQQIDCNSSDVVGPYSEFSVQFSRGNSFEELNNTCPAGARHLEKLLVSNPLARNGKIDGNESLDLANEIGGCPLNGEIQTTFSVAIDDISMSPKNTSLLKTECRVPRELPETQLKPELNGVKVVVSSPSSPETSSSDLDDNQVSKFENMYSLPLRVGQSNLPTVYSENDNMAKDVAELSAEDNWEASFSRFGQYETTPENITLQVLNNNLTKTANHGLSARLFSESLAQREGMETLSDLFETVNFDDIVSQESCLSNDNCYSLTRNELSQSGFVEGAYRAASEHLISNANNGNYSLQGLKNLAQEDNISNFLTYAGWIIPANTARGHNTGYTQLTQNKNLQEQSSVSLENCLSTHNDNGDLLDCSMNTGYELTKNILGRNE